MWNITWVLFCPPSMSIRFGPPPSPGGTWKGYFIKFAMAHMHCKCWQSTKKIVCLTPWFLYFLIASFSFWAADLWALWKLSSALVKSACNLSRCSFHCLNTPHQLSFSLGLFCGGKYPVKLVSSVSSASSSRAMSYLLTLLPGIKSLLWWITVQLLQLGACVLCKLARVVLDLVPVAQKIEISLNNFGDDE